MKKKFGVGIDMVEIKRFEDKPYQKNKKFYKKIFGQSEINYCLKFKNPSPHFAGKFAIKEAMKKLLDESIDLSGVGFADVGKALEDALEEYDLKDRIVRFKILIDEKVLPAIDKASIESSLYSLGAFHVSRVSIEAITKRIVRDNSILNNKDDFSMFKAFVNSQDIEDDYKKSLLKEAKIIMGEV